MPTTFEKAFADVKKLVSNFEASKAEYLAPTYNEGEARNTLINKFFDALGWDASNKLLMPPSQQEVKLQRNVTVGLSQRFADYAFYVAPHFRKTDVRFFGEAKKPAGELVTPDHCFQTIRYGWNADNTPLAVLTSFRQLVVLDCRSKPDIKTATKRVIQSYAYTDYADAAKFREIFDLLSRDAVAAGSLAAFAEPRPGKLPIGDAFLQELDIYRGTLARAFKNRNPDLTGDTLTEITQRTLDRLVFLRFLEDKLIETKESVANFAHSPTAWLAFVKASGRLNGIYNGIVFRHHNRLDDPNFQVDDGDFVEVCQWLSDPYSPYLFNIIPIHILGSIYEQFLGKVIVTTDKRARVEEKPEVRKAGGVHYTPEYIAHYLVANTVGKLIAGKTPAQIAQMAFADISCGSGSILLAAYDLLLQYHRDWYNANPDKAKKAGCVPDDEGAWRLSLQQRREILVNNIYGVDIDHQAVEVCQLSLYLKLLEEETTATAQEYQLEFHETLLPTLKDNIVCGNSLIENDFSLDMEERRRVNAMDMFPKIVKRGGFDAIVGNPPYISMLLLDKNQAVATKDYWKRKYQSAAGAFDIYVLFIEMAIRLVRKNGFVSYIVPNKFLAAEYAVEFRKWLIQNCQFVSILDFSRVKVWPVSVYPVVPVFRKAAFDPKQTIAVFAATKKSLEDIQKLAPVPCGRLTEVPDNLWSFITQKGAEVLMKVMESYLPLEKVADVWGASTVAEGSEYPSF